MDKRRLLEDHLAQAERHVLQGENLIRRQRHVAQQLEWGGHTEPAAEAEKLLQEFEELQQLHVAGRDRLRAELEALTGNYTTAVS